MLTLEVFSLFRVRACRRVSDVWLAPRGRWGGDQGLKVGTLAPPREAAPLSARWWYPQFLSGLRVSPAGIQLQIPRRQGQTAGGGRPPC